MVGWETPKAPLTHQRREAQTLLPRPSGKLLLRRHLLCRIPSASFLVSGTSPSPYDLAALYIYLHFSNYNICLLVYLSSQLSRVKIVSSLSLVFPVLGTYYALKKKLFSGSCLSLKCSRVLKCIISLYRYIGENLARFLFTALQSSQHAGPCSMTTENETLLPLAFKSLRILKSYFLT